jgi:hypothetical protein
MIRSPERDAGFGPTSTPYRCAFRTWEAQTRQRRDVRHVSTRRRIWDACEGREADCAEGCRAVPVFPGTKLRHKNAEICTKSFILWALHGTLPARREPSFRVSVCTPRGARGCGLCVTRVTAAYKDQTRGRLRPAGSGRLVDDPRRKPEAPRRGRDLESVSSS